MAGIFNEQPGAGFNPAPRTPAENAALIKAIKAKSGAYGENESNYGGGAALRSVFNLEGPESLGANINIPALDGGLGSDDRRNVLGNLGLGANLSANPDVQLAIRQRLKDETSGSESFNFPVERFSFDSEGNFLGGLMDAPNRYGDLPTLGGPTFDQEDDLQTIMADLEATRREIKDSAVLPRFDQEIIEGTGEGLSTGNIKQVLKSEAEEIDALLGNDPVFDDPMGDVSADLAKIKKDKRIKEELIRNETELSEAQTPAEKKYFDTPGGGGRDAAAMSKEKANTQSEQLFIASMEDFILDARGKNPTGPKNKTIEQYKQEFSDATGIDVSGKVDNRLALMAGGLSLLKNRAGKGFNVSKMLESVGEAGEAAMPELAAARKETKQAGLSAGKFALEMQSSDEAKRKTAAEKAMNRTSYYVMPKSEGINGFINNMDKAKRQRLNAFELNALTMNKEFDEDFEVISADSYIEIVKKSLEAPEAVDKFASTKSKIRLFEGSGGESMYTLDIFDVAPNQENGPSVGKLAGGIDSADQIYRELIDDLKYVNKADEDLAKAVSLATDTTTTGEMVANWAKGIASKVGFQVEGDTPTDQLKFFLNRMATENATAILGESGKTLSDGDRKRVDELISQLQVIGGDNPQAMAAKLKQFRETIVVKKRRAILSAFQTLDRYSRQDYSELYSDGDFSEEDEAELLKRRKARDKKDN